jgi:Zn-dependent oligopeptidase
MKYPEILPAMRLCKLESTRKSLDFAHSSRCQKENIELLESLISLRHELAVSLGYSSYSDYILEIRMAKDPVNVQNFEEELTLKLL